MIEKYGKFNILNRLGYLNIKYPKFELCLVRIYWLYYQLGLGLSTITILVLVLVLNGTILNNYSII